MDKKNIKRIKDFAETGIELCHKSLTKSIINLCLEISEQGRVIGFTKTLILLQTNVKRSRSGIYYTTETILCNGIIFGKDGCPYFVVGMGDDWSRTSFSLSLDNLTVIYYEMLNVIKQCKQ